MNRNFKRQKFHVRKVKCLVRATERKMSVWRMETSDKLRINTSKCALVIGGEVYVAWKRKMLHDLIGGYQAYIQRKKDLFIYL